MTDEQPVPAGATVLLAEDFDDARELYRDYLEFSGFRVITAVDGEEAVRLARAHRPDLILLDIRMPVMTGTEALRLLRADGMFASVPIAALTAHALDAERNAIAANGFDAVITKPCLPDDLVAIVRSLLAGRSTGTDVT